MPCVTAMDAAGKARCAIALFRMVKAGEKFRLDVRIGRGSGLALGGFALTRYSRVDGLGKDYDAGPVGPDASGETLAALAERTLGFAQGRLPPFLRELAYFECLESRGRSCVESWHPFIAIQSRMRQGSAAPAPFSGPSSLYCVHLPGCFHGGREERGAGASGRSGRDHSAIDCGRKHARRSAAGRA